MKAVTLYRPRNYNSSILENALSGFDRYLDSFFTDNFLSPSERILNRLPAVDVRENEKNYVLEMELPGFDEKDIEIRLDGNKLSIESKKEEEKNEENANRYLLRERRSSSINRSFMLPENADTEGISASFKNGILSLAVNKKPEAQQRVIEISKG